MAEDLVLLVDAIYEAAMRPDLWASVLQRIATDVDAAGTHLFTIGLQKFGWVSSPDVAHVTDLYIADNWPERTDRAERIFRHPEKRFLTDLDVYTSDELRREPVFQEFLIPNGMGWGTATGMRMPSGDLAVIDVERSYARGAFDHEETRRLDALRPHLGRALLLTQAAGLGELRGRADAFGSIGLPAAILGQGGRVLVANEPLRALAPGVVTDRPPGLQFADPRAQAALDAAFGLIERGSRTAPAPIHLPATRAGPGHLAYLLPLRATARDVVVGSVATILLSPIAAPPQPSAAVLRAVFGLTAAEARVAAAVAGGRTVDDVSGDLRVTRETIRTQLKSVFAKTGTRRQLDLARLLASPAFRRPEGD